MHQSFVSYRNYRYAVLGGLMVTVTMAAYVLDHPRVPPNGGTVLGYTLGTVAALLVLFLSAFGIRKRVFRSGWGTALGWASAHVYLGLAGVVVATLHSGMRFGWNVHTLAYVLMCGVSASGLFGMYAYIRYPGVMAAQRGREQRRQSLQHLAELDERCREIAAASADTRHLIADAIRRTDLGGTGLWAALRPRDESCLMVREFPGRRARLLPNRGQRTLVEILARQQLRCCDAAQRARLEQLLELTGERSALLARARRETQLAALLRVWLHLHVPLCCALLAALVAHVLSVFLYW